MEKEFFEPVYEIIPIAENTGVRFYTSYDSGSYVPKHWHDAIEIVYIQEGKLSVVFDGSVHELDAGDCILLNSAVVHSTKCISSNKAIVFQIPTDFFQQYIPDFNYITFSLEIQKDNPVQQTKLNILKETLVQMQIANDIRPKGYALRFNSLLFEVMYQLYHSFSFQVYHSHFKQKLKDMERLDIILKYTIQNYKRHIPLDEIAGLIHLQTRYFCRFFKKNMGVTFLEYQNELRLSYIYKEIIDTVNPIYEILERHGFTNYKLFRRMFYEHFNATPIQVRNQKTHAPVTLNRPNAPLMDTF